MSNQETPEGDCPPMNCSAFPAQDSEEFNGQRALYAEAGMTLRDYFAAKAMAAMMTQPEGATDWTEEKIADWSYSAADAMLIRRQNDQAQP